MSKHKIARLFPIVVFTIILLGNTPLFSQTRNKGVPFIINYTPQDYKASQQNWSCIQDSRGVMYFGNSHGVLAFDGNNWDLIGLPNKTNIRSLAIDKAGKIFVGGQNDFGYLETDSIGRLYFQSLKAEIEKQHQDFADVWKILVTNEGVVFFTYSKIYYLSKGKIVVFEAESGEFNFPFYVNGRLLIPERGIGLQEIKNGKIALIPDSKSIAGEAITAMLAYDNEQLLVVTANRGMFFYDGKDLKKWNTKADDFWIQNSVNCATVIEEGYALGSSNKGLLIIDKKGNSVQHINKQKGLQSSDVLSIYPDNNGNLWLGLYNGIDFIEINSPFTFLNDKTGVTGTAFASAIHNNKIYLGTNEGIFYKEWSSDTNPLDNQFFKPLYGAEGQVNNLQLLNNKVLLSHHGGAFEIKGNQLIRLSEHSGIWMFMPLKKNPGYVLCGTYTGLLVYKFVDGKLKFQHKIRGFNESSRVMEEDEEGNIWIAHGYKGIYKLKLSSSLNEAEGITFYNQDHGFPSNLFINVFKINNNLVFTGERGIFKYNKTTNRFDPHEEFSNLFDREKHIRKLVEDKEGNIWFSAGDDLGFLKKTVNGTYDLRKNQFNKLQGKLVGGFEHISYYDKSTVIIGIDEGFVHYNPSFSSSGAYSNSFTTLIRRVEITSESPDSLIFGGNTSNRSTAADTTVELPFRHNSLRFNYSATSFEDVGKVQYQYFLEGFDKNWSAWAHQIQKEYTNLPEGNYTFHVRAKNIYDNETADAVYAFSIRPPFIRSFWAYVIYGFLFVGLLIIFKKLKDRSVAREKLILKTEQEKALKLQEAQHMEEVLKAEKEIIKLNNEKLENELIHKSKELTSSALHVMQSMETIQKIRDQIQAVIEKTNEKSVNNQLSKILRAIEEDIKFQNNWEQFELHFNQIHEDFLKRLRHDFPDLNHRDIKLCAYLRLNLSSKEIAPLLNLSVRGIETSRYRIRKKMNLEQDVNLTEFILKY